MIDTGLSDPLGQAGQLNAEALGHNSAGHPLSQEEGNNFLLLLRREPPARTVGLLINQPSGGHGVSPVDLSSKPREAQPLSLRYRDKRRLNL
jgi:hypothetical protein